MDYIVHGILQARILEWVAFPFSRGPSQPRDQTQSPTLQVNLPAEPQGKPENTGVGSLSPLQVDPLNLGIKPGLCIASRFFTNWAIREAQANSIIITLLNQSWVYLPVSSDASLLTLVVVKESAAFIAGCQRILS